MMEEFLPSKKKIKTVCLSELNKCFFHKTYLFQKKLVLDAKKDPRA